ncbi:ketoacyl-ACP synthase III [Clostridium sp.]|uniref:ketoacyl-ACP synthase III n=1 Tax=Clostridium sp. TaxID=1506 RepID=UPI0032179A18
MYKNVHITGVGAYHPKKLASNEDLINHFKPYGSSEHAAALMDSLGRETRTFAEEGETSITMALEASKIAINKAGISTEDIDMIISVSDTPEYLSPCCALLIKNKLNAINSSSVFDVNSNCTGMLTAMDIASRYIKTHKKYKKVLVVGSLLISPLARKDDIVAYGCAADGAAAVILELREENEERGLLDSITLTDDNYHWSITMPACGMSKVTNSEIEAEDKKMLWKPFDFSFLSEKWNECIRKLVTDNDYKIDDVSHYFMSQFSKADLELTISKLDGDDSKSTFIGNKYGYTGCTSPIMALDDRLKYEKFNKDDIVVFCSVASGYSICALLYKW